MERYIREHNNDPRGRLGKVRKWLIGCLTPAFAVCLAVGLFLYFPISSGVQTYAADVSANPLINSNIGKHSEWYYGFGTVDDTATTDVEEVALDPVSEGYARWYAQLGVDVGKVTANGKSLTQTAREHKLVQASSYKEGATDKVFIINSPEEAAKVWTEAVEFALGQSADSPFKADVDQSLDPITNAVQKIPGGGVARGNYFADPYTVEGINGGADQTSYRGKYITVKLNCDWYAKDIETNIAFALGNNSMTPSEQVASGAVTHDKRWITTFNWAKDEVTFNSYWLGEDNWDEGSSSRSDIRSGYSQSNKVTLVPGEKGTVTDRQLTSFTADGHGYSSTDGYYASYDLSTLADQTANAQGQKGFNISSPFSYGRINVPTGAYIVLDLNGHTISRGLTEENNEEIAAHGSILKSKYEYDLGEVDALNKFVKIYDGKTLADVDGGHLYGNELCYYGSVMTVQPKARLEIVDSTAFERASDGRITASGNTYTTNHKGTVTGGCTDEKYYPYMDNDLGVENGAYFGYNSNEGKGGAVHVNASGELVVHSGTFKDNQAQFGGAFYALSRAAVLVYNGYFINNYATLRGGATYVASQSRSVFTFYDGVISYNRAADGGGGVYLCDRAYVNLHGGYITHNQAGRWGGGVYIGDKGEGLLENVNITQNVSGLDGGGIYVHETSKFQFAGSLIVTQNYGNCGEFYTRDTVSDSRLKIPYVLRLTVDGAPVVSCGWDGAHGQYRYDWRGTATNLKDGYHRAVVGADADYPKEMYEPAAYCKHDETGKETRAPGEGVHNYTGQSERPYPMWSLGDAANKEYNCIGGVIWTKPGNAETIGTGGTANNVYLASGAKIIIGGPLFANGIGAQIGVTMEGSGDFTSQYSETESSVIPQLYFTSDDAEKSVTWNADKKEAVLGSKASDPTELTWEITGYLYGADSPITIKATGEEETSFSWNTYSPSYHPDEVDASKTINSFKWTGKTMMFDHKMFEVTKVVAKQGDSVKSTWEISDLASHEVGTDYTFHYLLAQQGEENEATDDRLVYAGDYSFRVNEDGFSNATFTIHINQLGVGVSAYEVKNGSTTWKDKGNPFKDGNTPSTEEIETYLEGALYYRGTPYQFVLDSKYDSKNGTVLGKEDEGKFTGAVMKFVYANTDFFGPDVEIDFGKVNFDLEYYWRELTDNTQQDLEKTNYFLHAGYYEVRGAHEVAGEGTTVSSVDYMKNNITFESEMHLPIQRVSVSVWLETNASIKDEGYYGYTYKDGVYTTKQILYFNNNDEAGNDPELDKNVVVSYYDFDDYIKNGSSKATPVGIQDVTDGVERWGVKDAGKYVVHVSLNTQMWVENGDPGKDDFTERGKPYNDYIFTSNETQRLSITPKVDEQGREVEYEFAYYFFIQPAVVTSWEDNIDPHEAGAGHLNFQNRTFDATDTEPAISGKMKSATEANAYYTFGDFTGDTDGVYVRYLKKTAENTDNLGTDNETLKGDYSFTYEDVAQYGALTAAELKSVSNAAIAKWFQEETKFKPVDAGDYWILVWFRGVSPMEDNKGSGSVSDPQNKPYVPVTNFKGVFIGTYTIAPVEVTVSGSLSYTYDGRSYERARYLPPRDGGGEEDAWFESIFFLVQDGITTPNELVVNQHADTYTTPDTYQSWEGGEAQNRSLRDLWGGNNTYNDAVYYKSRFTLGNVTVTYTNEEFKQHDIEFGIGLYAFKTKTANQGVYHLTTVGADENGKVGMTDPRVNTEPTNEGVTWIITYKPKDGTQTQAFNTSTNFVINTTTSFLEVTINQKNIGELAGDITKVGIQDFTHWKAGADKDNPAGNTLQAKDGSVVTGIEYPFAGDNWVYRPGVTIDYQPFYYAESVEHTTGRTEYGDELRLQGEDYTISYIANSSATGSNSAHIVLYGTGNYTGFLTLDFTITPAQIAVQYAGVGYVPQYDKTAHGVNVKYANVEDDATYQALAGAGILVRSSGGGTFNPATDKPQPDAAVYTITYNARTRTADGFGGAADPEAITGTAVPIDAGVYDVKIVLGSANYQFVSGKDGGSYFTPVEEGDGYSNAATGSHTILPAVVSFEYTNSGEIYNRQTHTPQIKFTNITYQQHSDLRTLQNVVPLALGDDYEVEIAPVSSESYGENATDAGEYYVRVKLKSHNYCFDLELVKSGDLIIGYKDGATSEDNYPESRNDKAHTYSYSVHAESKDYTVDGTTAAVANFVIGKATITLDRFTDGTYNRTAQPQTPSFSNTERNNEAVPTHSGQNAGVSVTADEFTVTYTDENIISTTDSLDGDRNPFYSDLYSVTITLTEAGEKNFKFETRTIVQPRFAHSETADATLLGQRLGEGEDDSVIIAPFLINRVDITITQRYASDVYNAKDHFAETAGIALEALENWVSTMFQYSSSEAIQADDLTVEIVFSKKDGEPFATAYYYPNNEGNKVSFNGKEDYTFAEFAGQGQFTHVGEYEITVRFTDKSFYIANSGASNDGLTPSADFEYSITAAQISFSLAQPSFPYDTKAHQQTYPDGGVDLTNTRDAKVLPALAKGDVAGVGEVAVAYGYSGWAGSDVESSDGFKNVGTYTVTLTLQESGDFQFADGSYSLSRTYTIDAMDIGKEAGNFQDAVFTPSDTEGHSDYEVPAYHYTGREIQPEITLTDSKSYGIELKTTEADRLKVGLSVAYTENINAGTATAALTGVNNFTGSRTEEFWVLPAIVSITASDSTHSETFNPNVLPEETDKGSLTFSYNKTLQLLTYTFENLCGSAGTTPTSADYTVKYYKADDWDKVANKPNDGAVPLEAEGITDSGDYYVWFEFVKGTKERSNFVFYKEDSAADEPTGMFDLSNPHLFAYGFQVTVTPAEIQINLADQFKGEGGFVNEFDFNRQNWATTLNSAQLTGTNGVVPTSSDYEIFFSTDGTDSTRTETARDAGNYYLVFKLTDTAGNYVVSGVYAGTGDGAIQLNPVEKGGEGYHAEDEDSKHISVFFTVKKAEIEVYLAEQFKSGSEFVNSFGFDRSDRASVLRTVIFKNELRNNIIPINTDYSLTFLKDADPTDQVINAGSYTLKFELTGADRDNFVIYSVRAGKDGDKDTDYVELSKDSDYTTSDVTDMRSFEVGFRVTPADIEIHLADRFKSEGAFVNSFVYTRSNLYSVLFVISIKNADNVIPLGTDYTVSFKTELTGEDTTDIANVGKYYLVFKLSDDVAGNYNVTGIYAGDGVDASVPTASGEDDKGYHGDKKSFSVKFDITPAQIEVYLSEDFRSGSDFINEFGFNKSDRANALNSVQFKNELRNGIFPQNGEYSVALKSVGKDTETDTTAVRNVGSYKLVIALTEATKKNFEITAVYAGAPSATAGSGDAVKLDAVSKDGDKGYVKIGDEDALRSFSVAFTVIPAEIQVHVPEQFRNGDLFVNQFGFNKSSWATMLNGVTLSGKDDIVPTNNEYSVTFMLKDKDTVSDATDVGDYRLVFTLTDDAGNYVITAIYAGKDDTFDVKKKAGEAYQPLEGTLADRNLKKFSLAFSVTPAVLDLYLNAFRAGDAFTNSFVFDGTDQSVKLGFIELKNEGNIVPVAEAYEVSFFYNSDSEKGAADGVYDVGAYTLYFKFTALAGNNYVLRNIYAGSGSTKPEVSLTEDNYRDKTESEVYVDFTLTPATIDVYFSAGILKDGGTYVNKFYYDRNDWKTRFGMVYLDNTMEGNSAVPSGTQYSIEFYKCDSLTPEKETWGDTAVKEAITDIGRYSVTFRLSKELTGHYPGVKHYNNYTIGQVRVGGANKGDSVPLDQIDLDRDPTGADGYRVSKNAADRVYITLVFDIMPNVVKLEKISDKIFNDDAQDAGFTFSIVDSQGVVTPEAAHGDFALAYAVDDAHATENEKMKDGKPYFAGAYTVSIELSDNFVFDTPDGERTTSGNFKITPVVLSAYLGYTEGDGITEGSSSLPYDGLAHEYQIFTKTTAADIPLRNDGDGKNVYQVSEATYTGWAGNTIDDSDGYKNAGTYTLTLSFYIFSEDGTSTNKLGGNFSFGGESYTISLTYAIQQRTITDGDVYGIENGEHKVYNGKPQTNGIEVRMTLVEGKGETMLTLYDNDTKEGDYSISNTSDINVGAVSTTVNGMHNFQGSVDLSYYIDPAEVTATIDKTSLPYNAQDQSRSFTFVNTSGTVVLPAYNTNEGVSDYTIAYTFNGKTVTAPRNAGEYTVTVTLKNSAGYGDSSNFMFDESLDGRTGDTTATFTFTITKAEIYLDAIPDANYTGAALPAKVGFVNAANPSVVPRAYDVLYDEEATAPTHVKTDGVSRTPIAYSVKVTLINTGTEATDLERDLDNFVFVAHAGAATYVYDTESGTWGQEAYKITPAVITGSLSVAIEGVDHPDSSGNVYNAKQHALDVVFRNVDAGFSVIPEGTKGEVKAAGLAATYDFAADETVLYTLTITFTPNYSGFTEFDGVPVNAGSYLVAVALKSADFSFVNDRANFDWTYVISNAKIGAKDTVGKPDDTATFSREYAYAPDNPHDIKLTAEDFTFVEDEAGFNVSNATFLFTSCTGAAYEQITNDEGLAIGYRLTGAGDYTVTVTVDAPNHDRWDITIKITVTAQAIKLVVRGDAHFEATYGDAEAYTADNVLAQVLQFIRDGKILVENIAGDPNEKADTLVRYGFTIRIFTPDDSYSGAGYLKAGGYGLVIGGMEVGGFSGNFVVFEATDSTMYTGTVFTVNPLAIQVSTDAGINDLRYNGTSLVADAASRVVISNLYPGDDVFFASVRYAYSEGGNFDNGTVFDHAEAIHVGNYWVHVFGREGETENGLSGPDSANYMIEVKDTDSPTIRYNGKSGVYVAFEIKRREVELAIADSTSTYGDAEAVYGAEGAKKFNFSYIDTVLSADFGSGAKMTELYRFVLDLLALFNGAEKLDRATTPYPGAGSYIVKLDPDAGNGKDWVLGSGRFNFDKDYILRIEDTQSGAHVIGKRAMRVSVNDYSDFYGEELKESGFEGSEGDWGFKALDPFVDGDSEKDLAITITRDGTQFTAQGSQTASSHWGAMTYRNGLKPDSMSANYDVTFTEDSGNYIIKPRPVIVLIHQQSSVYGEPRVDDLTGSSAWEIYGTESEDNMGYATRETRADLRVTLSIESVVNETASAGVYENVIRGESANLNYSVTFRNWVVTDDGRNEAGDRTGGDYEITKRSVAIEIGSSEATYGTPNLREGMGIELTAPNYLLVDSEYVLQNAADAQWKYNFDVASYTILPQHLGYLTFYLGKADPANAEKLYATVGTHAIIGVWGFGYDAAMTFMKSYDVQFFGKWEGSGAEDPNYHTAGVFTVTPADILRDPDIIWEGSNLYRQYKEGDKTPATGWYALQIAANYLIYAGDYTDASGGKLEFAPDLSDGTKLVYYVKVGDAVRATIAYSKPTNTTQIEQEVEEIDNLWNIHSVGIWHMQVTVEAANHNPANFIYIYEIEAVVARVMLNTSKPALVEAYGKYEYILPGAEDYETKLKELPLTSVLHEYLEDSIMYVDGLAEAYPGTGFLDWIDMVLEYCRVEVSKAKVSTSGMLEAGSYHLRIVAESGCGFTVAFVDGVPDDGVVDYSGYDRLIIEQKELGIDWIGTNEPEPNESRPELRGSSIIYTYSSYNYHFDPLFTDVIESELGKDLVNQPIYNFYDAEGVLCENISDVGTYRIVINGALFGGDDASNYKLPEQLEIEVRILPMEVKVTLFDRGITYGDDLPGIVTPAANGDGTVTPSPSWTCDRLGVNDDARKLGVKVTYLDAAGREVQYNSAAGVYRIVGSAPDSNYHVTFVNASEDGDEAVLTIRRAHLTVTIESIKSGVIYGDKDHPLTFAVTPQEGDDEIAWWDLDRDTKDLLGIALTLDDTRDVGSYSIRGSWTNKNYNVVFAGDWEGDLPADYLREADSGEPLDLKQGAGTYVIAPRPIRLTLPETMQSIYGEFSTDGRLGTQKFSDYILTLVQLEAGQSFAYDEDISDLHLSWTLPEEDAARYEVFAVEDNDPNYDIDFGGHVLVWTVTARTVTVTIHTQHSAYGDTLVALDGSDLTFWTAENLAEWHKANAYGALGIELAYAGVTDRSNAGTYEGAIRATQTANLDNYTLVFHNDGGEAAYGTYIVDQRAITLEIGDFESTFGDYYDEDDFNALIVGGYTLAEGSTLASWDAEDSDFVLGTVLTKSAGYHANVYPIFGADTDDNYAIEFVPGTFTIHKATNEWLKHFSLESMNEGETPDEELLSAAAKFGSVTVKYYYDELCTSEVTEDLSALPKSTYYAKITVDDTSDYSGLEEVKEFVVNESFLVVNGGLDVTLFVCIFASQFIILTFALIFIRRKKAKNNETKEMK